MQRRALVFLILATILAILALQTSRTLLYILAYLLWGLLLFSLLWAASNIYGVHMGRSTRSLRTQVGRPFEERLSIENRGWLPKLWLEVEDASELPEHHVSRVVNGLSSRSRKSWTVKSQARYRGRYRLGPITLRSGDPFGLFVFRRFLPQSQHVTIYPMAYPLPGFHPLVGQQLGEGERRRRTQAITPSFAGVRDYVPGDTLNRIHWRSSARMGRLIVKEFEEDPASDIWIILDMHQRTHVEAPELDQLLDHMPWSKLPLPEILPVTTEYAVTAAASLMRHFLEQNRQVGMIAHADRRELMQPDRGQRPLAHALDYLSVLQATGERTLRDVLLLESYAFKRGSTLVIITSDSFASWVESARDLQRRGVRVIAILIEGRTFDVNARPLDEVSAQLAIVGIPAYILRKGDSIPAALQG